MDQTKADVKAPLFVALDVDQASEAKALASQLAGSVRGFKVGPRLLLREGQKLIESLSQSGEVFVDCKYYDIPSTMEASVRATFEAGATFCTVHAGAGTVALRRLARLEKELNQQRFFRTLGVTALTSFDEQNQPPHWKNQPLEETVRGLASAAFDSGLRGFVCSVQEVSALRQFCADGFFVTPGVRLSQDARSDQKRVATPEEALRAGASALVVGRPIVAASDPILAARLYIEACERGQY